MTDSHENHVTTGETRVVFGPDGFIGSIHGLEDGYTVVLPDETVFRELFPTVEAAGDALARKYRIDRDRIDLRDE